MSTVDVIAAALAAGAGAGMQDTASAAVRDAYAGLKGVLSRWLTDRDDARLALEADETEAGVWQARIGDALLQSGAADDEHVVAAAKRLLAMADPVKAKIFDIKVDTNFGAIGSFTAPITFNQGPPIPPTTPAAR